MNHDYRWILSVIGSCQNEWQLDACFSLVNLFIKKYKYERGMVDDRFALLDAIDKKKTEFT